MTRHPGRRPTLIAATALTAAATLFDAGPSAADVRPDLAGVRSRVIDARPVRPDLPLHPSAVLATAVQSLGSAFGFRLDVTDRIAAAHVEEPTLARLAVLTQTLSECYLAAAPARTAVTHFGVPAEGASLSAAAATAFTAAALPIAACAARLESYALETAQYLRTHQQAAAGGLDLWPVLRWSPGDTDDVVDDDYLLSVDQGGNDTYLNNAGSNLVDLTRGPAGSLAPTVAPARGCERFALEFPQECQVAVALLIDAAGHNTYGSTQDPDPTGDGYCTADPVVRRMATEGSGLAGVGMLIDGGDHDKYLGKVLAQGSGHLGGVGVLRATGGHNSYLAERNSQGYALTGGFGMLREDSGDNRYDYYTPGPLNPHLAYPQTDERAGLQQPGGGGTIDDTGVCDSLPRMMQGTATQPGSLGVLIDTGDDDYFHGTPPATQLFDPSLPGPLRYLHHGSQGFGGDQGTGYFQHLGANARYEGVPGHAPNTTIVPAPPDNIGYFTDHAGRAP